MVFLKYICSLGKEKKNSIDSYKTKSLKRQGKDNYIKGIKKNKLHKEYIQRIRIMNIIVFSLNFLNGNELRTEKHFTV